MVANGSVSVELKYGVFALIQKAWPLCEFVRSNHRHCPLEKGPLRIEFNGTVPKLWPSVRKGGRGRGREGEREGGREAL